MLADRIAGRENALAATFDPNRVTVRSAPELAKTSAGSRAHVGDRLMPAQASRPTTSRPARRASCAPAWARSASTATTGRRARRLAALHAPGLPAALQRRRAQLGLPVPRLALRRRRRGARRARRCTRSSAATSRTDGHRGGGARTMRGPVRTPLRDGEANATLAAWAPPPITSRPWSATRRPRPGTTAPQDLGGLFGAPPWLRDLGVTAWLVVGVTLAARRRGLAPLPDADDRPADPHRRRRGGRHLAGAGLARPPPRAARRGGRADPARCGARRRRRRRLVLGGITSQTRRRCATSSTARRTRSPAGRPTLGGRPRTPPRPPRTTRPPAVSERVPALLEGVGGGLKSALLARLLPVADRR